MVSWIVCVYIVYWDRQKSFDAILDNKNLIVSLLLCILISKTEQYLLIPQIFLL